MQLKPDFELREVCGENVVIPCGIGNVNFDRIIHLNETGAFLWKEATKGDFSTDTLTEALLNEYEVEADVARKDVEAFINQLVTEQLAQ